jgi:hypothetical protein
VIPPERDRVIIFNAWTIHDRLEMSSQRAVRDRILAAIR